MPRQAPRSRMSVSRSHEHYPLTTIEPGMTPALTEPTFGSVQKSRHVRGSFCV